MHILKRLFFAAALLALLPACASNSGSGGSGQNYAGRQHHQQSAPQSNPYTDPLFDNGEDAAKSAYVLANLKERQRVYWYNAQTGIIYFLAVSLSPAPETGRPREVEIATKRPDGRVVMLKAKARTEGDGWKVFSPFVVPLDENGQRLLEADYKEAYRRATTPPEKPVAKQAGKPGAKAADAAKQTPAAAIPAPGGWTLPADAPAGLVAAGDFDFPVVSDPRPQKPADSPPSGRHGRRGGGGGGGGMGGGLSGGGVMGGSGGMGGM
jgi:uncharacterized membrane protein YgcG